MSTKRAIDKLKKLWLNARSAFVANERGETFNAKYQEFQKFEQKYDLAYSLSDEQIHLLALLLIANVSSKSLAKVYANYPIYNNFNLESIEADYNKIININKGDVEDAKENVIKNNKPAFFMVVEHNHIITIAIVPNKEDTNGCSLVYVNPIIEDIEKSGGLLAEAGLEFAKTLAQYLEIPFNDFSYPYQYENCCGLFSALFIAKIAQHFEQNREIANIPLIFKSLNNSSREKTYSMLGSILIEELNNHNLQNNLCQKIDLKVSRCANQFKILKDIFDSYSSDGHHNHEDPPPWLELKEDTEDDDYDTKMYSYYNKECQSIFPKPECNALDPKDFPKAFSDLLAKYPNDLNLHLIPYVFLNKVEQLKVISAYFDSRDTPSSSSSFPPSSSPLSLVSSVSLPTSPDSDNSSASDSIFFNSPSSPDSDTDRGICPCGENTVAIIPHE